MIICACDKLPIRRYASRQAILELVAEHAQDKCDRHSCKRRAEKSAEASPSAADTRGRTKRAEGGAYVESSRAEKNRGDAQQIE